MLPKAIKGLFFDEEETTTPVADTAPEIDIETPVSAPTPSSVTSSVTTPTVSAGINDDMANMLMEAIQDADLEGFDYLEFRNTVNEMGNTGMTEPNKFLAVFTTAKTMGLTYESLVDSIDHYLSVIAEKRDGFMGQVEAQIESEVQGRLNEVEERNAKITEAAEKIAELNQFIQDSQQENLASRNEANVQKMNIENTRASFEATYNMVAGKLNTDKDNIKSYLGSQAVAPVTSKTDEGA